MPQTLNTLPKSSNTVPYKGIYKMKIFLRKLFNFFEMMGKVRAATHFSRIGDYESAKKVMQG